MERNKNLSTKIKRLQSLPAQPNRRRRRGRRKSDASSKSIESVRISPFPVNLSEDSNSSSFVDASHLSNWGFNNKILQYYDSKGITKLFDWQVECLFRGKVLDDGQNLVYSAPTSAGKSMVSDILMFKQVLEKNRKAIVILPFISITHEKVLSLKYILKSAGKRVDSFAGSANPRGGLSRVDVAVCTIEKANSMINRLIEDKRLQEIGIIVVDELHMIGDSGRGYLLELLLTKVLYLNEKLDHKIQIVGMSATLPNLDTIAKWLKAELYVTSYRPVPLFERVKYGDVIFDVAQNTQVRKLNIDQLGIAEDVDPHINYLALESMTQDHGTLIFCATKAMCESVCRSIAGDVYEFGKGKKPLNDETKKLKEALISVLNFSKISETMEQLRRCPAGLDPILERTVIFGVAFHHAGLSLDERSIIEYAFRRGVIKVLCATSTLSAGVNLPARLVIIRSPNDYKGSTLDVLTYQQMIGRAGRQGVDTMGESILICSEKDQNKAKELLNSSLKPVKSCLVKGYAQNSSTTSSSASNSSSNASIKHHTLSTGLKRAVLEIIANGTASNYDDVFNYISCTLLASSCENIITNSIIDEVLTYLIDRKLIHSIIDSDSQEKKITPTQLGRAVLASAISPDDGLFILDELNKAKQNMCLSNDLHLLYEVTPTYLSEQMETIDWHRYHDIWNHLEPDLQKVGKLIGISEYFIINQMKGHQNATQNDFKKLSVHKRFYTCLALFDLIQEVPLHQVSKKFHCSKGVLQSLQQNASSFAGMITVFCNKLGWHNMEILIEQFQSRLYFGVQRELIDLMRINCLNAATARLLFNHKYDTVASLACVNPSVIELILMNGGPFDKNKEMSSSTVWVPGQCKAMNTKEMAASIVLEARELIQKDLGLCIEHWGSEKPSSPLSSQSDSLLSDINKLSQDADAFVILDDKHIESSNSKSEEEMIHSSQEFYHDKKIDNNVVQHLNDCNDNETYSQTTFKELTANSCKTCTTSLLARNGKYSYSLL